MGHTQPQAATQPSTSKPSSTSLTTVVKTLAGLPVGLAVKGETIEVWPETITLSKGLATDLTSSTAGETIPVLMELIRSASEQVNHITINLRQTKDTAIIGTALNGEITLYQSITPL